MHSNVIKIPNDTPTPSDNELDSNKNNSINIPISSSSYPSPDSISNSSRYPLLTSVLNNEPSINNKNGNSQPSSPSHDIRPRKYNTGICGGLLHKLHNIKRKWIIIT